jgi:ribonuclease T2
MLTELRRLYVRRSFRSLLFLLATTVAFGQPQRRRPGGFDYYLFTLSWAPEYCYSHRDSVECSSGKHYGFIVHGLWPQYFDGRYPERCSGESAPADPRPVSGIMPDPGLIRHEWITHGTCSGLGPTQYFELIRKIYDSIRIPPAFVDPDRSFTMQPKEIKQAFEAVNPRMRDSSIALNCPQNFLRGIQICVSKSGSLISCPANAARDCRASTIRIPPVL